MANFPYEKPSEAPTRLIVGKRRKDGKYPVLYIFPFSGKRLNKIQTLEDVREWDLKDPDCVIRFADNAIADAYRKLVDN